MSSFQANFSSLANGSQDFFCSDLATFASSLGSPWALRPGSRHLKGDPDDTNHAAESLLHKPCNRQILPNHHWMKKPKTPRRGFVDLAMDG